MNDPLARTIELAFVDITALATVDAVYVPPDIVSVAVLEFVTPAAVDAVMLPVIVTGPVLTFETPVAAAAVTLPTITKVPAPLLNAPPGNFPKAHQSPFQRLISHHTSFPSWSLGTSC